MNVPFLQKINDIYRSLLDHRSEILRNGPMTDDDIEDFVYECRKLKKKVKKELEKIRDSEDRFEDSEMIEYEDELADLKMSLNESISDPDCENRDYNATFTYDDNRCELFDDSNDFVTPENIFVKIAKNQEAFQELVDSIHELTFDDETISNEMIDSSNLMFDEDFFAVDHRQQTKFDPWPLKDMESTLGKEKASKKNQILKNSEIHHQFFENGLKFGNTNGDDLTTVPEKVNDHEKEDQFAQKIKSFEMDNIDDKAKLRYLLDFGLFSDGSEPIIMGICNKIVSRYKSKEERISVNGIVCNNSSIRKKYCDLYGNLFESPESLFTQKAISLIDWFTKRVKNEEQQRIFYNAVFKVFEHRISGKILLVDNLSCVDKVFRIYSVGLHIRDCTSFGCMESPVHDLVRKVSPYCSMGGNIYSVKADQLLIFSLWYFRQDIYKFVTVKK